MGWGVVESGLHSPVFIGCGVITTPPDMRLQDRLIHIRNSVQELLTTNRPDEIVFEELFFARNVTTALTVGAARGVAISACAVYSPLLYADTPMQIKQGITGYGRADQHQVQQMVMLILKLSAAPKPDDAADAVAAAITHLNAGPAKIQFRMK
ncbi:MAG: crossover junction endodeoxyribonuclease RuvC, partial [Clostridiales bacterium]|nr:crossover junction endodeoxyribonuclease RuvC [Clostridiales bacterium]